MQLSVCNALHPSGLKLIRARSEEHVESDEMPWNNCLAEGVADPAMSLDWALLGRIPGQLMPVLEHHRYILA